MDVCGICGKKKSFNIKLMQAKDGLICSECIGIANIVRDHPNQAERLAFIKSLTLDDLDELIYQGEQEQERLEKEKQAKAERQLKEQERVEAELKAKEAQKEQQLANMPVTTMDIQKPYEIVGPIFFQTSNKGIFSSAYKRLEKQYRAELDKRRSEGQFSPMFADWGFLFGTGWGVGQNSFDPAFYIAVQELKKRALAVGAEGIVGLRMDIDLDTNGFEYFYLQVYGTAIKFI